MMPDSDIFSTASYAVAYAVAYAGLNIESIEVAASGSTTNSREPSP